MQSELSLSFCLHWAKYFMFVLGEHQILILARNSFQNKPPGIQLNPKRLVLHLRVEGFRDRRRKLRVVRRVALK